MGARGREERGVGARGREERGVGARGREELGKMAINESPPPKSAGVASNEGKKKE